MQCGALLPGGGLCGVCGVIHELEAATACATCSTLTRNRLEWLGLQLGEAIAAAEGNTMLLGRGLALVMFRDLLDAEFEAGERAEPEHDRALYRRERS
jgi:hypothetical protein